MENELKNKINKILNNIDEKLGAATLLFDNERSAEALIIAYYALHLGFQAALMAGKIEITRSSDVAGLFMKNFVNTGIFDASVIELMKKIEVVRDEALYVDGQELDREKYGKILSEIYSFIKKEKKYLHNISQTGTEKKFNKIIAISAAAISAVLIISAIFLGGHYLDKKENIIQGASLRDLIIAKKPQDLRVEVQPVWWEANASNQLFILTPGEGDKISFRLDIKKTAMYDLYVSLTESYDYGIIQFGVNGKDVGDAIDLYSKDVRQGAKTYLGKIELKAGDNILEARVSGKNPISKGYFFGIVQLTLKRVK